MESRVDGEVLRSVMRHVPSPVTIVTVAGEEEIRGITIGSFTSASLHPPLVSFNVGREATIYDVLTNAEWFAVHVLSDEQAFLSDHFSIPDVPGAEQFEDIDYELGRFGTPILSDTLAVLQCRRHAVYDAGDHSIVLGLVEDVRVADFDGSPLVYFNRSYRRVGKEAQPTLFDPVVDESA